MTDPLSLTEAKRLAGGADTILLRATRNADLETPIGAFLRLDDGATPAYLLESVEGGERLGRYSFLGIGPRRLLEVGDGVARTTTRPVSVDSYSPDLPVTTTEVPDPLAALRAFVPTPARACPTEGMPRFTGGAVGALSLRRDRRVRAVGAAARTRTRSASRWRAFIETDLVLVFDHLSHQLSAIASLHTEAPDLDGRYRIAERAIFEALERTARPSQAEMAAAFGRSSSTDGAAARTAFRRGRHVARPRRLHPRRRAREGRDRGRRGDPGRPRPAPVVRPPERRRRHAHRRHRPVPRAAARQPVARTCSSPGRPSFEVVGASPELLLQVVGDRMTTHPIAGHPAAGRHAGRRRPLADELRGDPKERAEHVMLVDLGRNDLGRVARAGHRDHQPVHGGRALQPRPPPREPRRGEAPARSWTRSTRCAPCSPRAR